MAGNLMAGWEASRDSGDRFCGVPNHGSHWSSITTAWAKTLLATEMGDLDAAASTPMTVLKSNTMTARRISWTRWHSLSQETLVANTAVKGRALAHKVRQSLTIQIATITPQQAVNRLSPVGCYTTGSGSTKTNMQSRWAVVRCPIPAAISRFSRPSAEQMLSVARHISRRIPA